MLLESSSSVLRESKENIASVKKEEATVEEVGLEELDLMTSHVCFQIYHLPSLSLGRYLDMCVPYIAPLIDSLEANAPLHQQNIFTRRLFAIIAGRFNPSLIEEALMDYFLEREHSTIPLMVTLGMKPHLTRYAERAVATMARQLCRESESLEALLNALRTARVALFVGSVSGIVFRTFLLHQLTVQYVIPRNVLEQLVEYEIPVQECWPVLERTLDIYLLSDTKVTFDILAAIEPIVQCHSQLDASCYLLEECLLKIKAYIQERTDWDISLMRYLLQHPPERMIEFDDPLKDYDPFSNTTTIWTPDPDFCTKPIRTSTKSLSRLTIIANLYASPNSFVKALQGVLLREYFFKGQSPSGLADALRFIPESHCLSVMLKDFENSCEDLLVISQGYWPKLQKESDIMIEHSENDLILEHLFDIHTYRFTFESEQSIELHCTSSQAALIDRITSNSSLGISEVANLEVAIFWLEQGVLMLRDNNLLLSDVFKPTPEARLLLSTQNSSASSNIEAGYDFESMKPFIRAMLTNLGPMSAVKVHSTLGMFSSDYTNTDQTALLTFLESLVSIGFLSFDNSLAAFK